MLTAALLAALSSPARADEPPVALAGVPFLAYPGERIVLDGSESYDPEGEDLAFTWSQSHGPAVTLREAETPNPEFDAEVPGTYTFELVVDDGLQASEPDAVDVIVVDPGIGGDADGGGCATLPRAGGAPTPLAPTLLALLLLPLRRRRS